MNIAGLVFEGRLPKKPWHHEFNVKKLLRQARARFF